jgi:hypothetical protein
MQLLQPLCSRKCGRSSVVERQLPKLNVVGSIPIARSIARIVGLEGEMAKPCDSIAPSVTTGSRSHPAFYAVILSSVMIVAAGILLWWREGDKLFSDGLILAMMRCF